MCKLKLANNSNVLKNKLEMIILIHKGINKLKITIQKSKNVKLVSKV